MEAAVQKVRLDQWQGSLEHTPILICRNGQLPPPEPTQRKYLFCLSDRPETVSETYQTAATLGVHVVGFDYAKGTFFQQTQEPVTVLTTTGNQNRNGDGR